MGFDGLFFGRLDWRDKETRSANHTMETLWNAGYYKNDELFNGVLYNYYSPPPGFCWDMLCNDEPIMDNPTLPFGSSPIEGTPAKIVRASCIVSEYKSNTAPTKARFLLLYT